MTSGYKTIDAMIETVKEKFGKEHKISVMFENCISNTLSTTIKTLDDGSVFVITGDIPAMWLRDSSCQLRPVPSFCKGGTGNPENGHRTDPETGRVYSYRCLCQRF